MHADFVIDVNERKMPKNRRGRNGPIPVRTATFESLYDPDLDEAEVTTRVKMKPKRKIITMLRKLAPWNF